MGKVTSRDGTEIAYEAVGQGPAIIMVMGATAFRGIDPSAAELAALMGGDFTFVTYDRRGRGESGDTRPYAVEREIEDIAALIGAVGGEAALYGLSSGAVLAIEAAAAGLPLSALIAYEPPFRVLDDGMAIPDDYVETLESAVAAGRPGDAVAYFMRKGVGVPEDQIAGMQGSPFWPVLEGVAPTIAYDGRIMIGAFAGKAFPQRWQKVSVPTLVVCGDQTFPFIPASVDAVVAALPGASKAVLAGQGHGPEPKAIAPLLADFVGKAIAR